jgi:hypothetical protein
MMTTKMWDEKGQECACAHAFIVSWIYKRFWNYLKNYKFVIFFENTTLHNSILATSFWVIMLFSKKNSDF